MNKQELINSITDENQRNFIKIGRLLGLSARSVIIAEQILLILI
jgi:hypothetical protein